MDKNTNLYRDDGEQFHLQLSSPCFSVISFFQEKGDGIDVLFQGLVKSYDLYLFSIEAVHLVLNKFPEVTILTSEVHPVAPNHFGQKYFGTE